MSNGVVVDAVLIALGLAVYGFGWIWDYLKSKAFLGAGYVEESWLIRKFGMAWVKSVQLAVFVILAVVVGFYSIRAGEWLFLGLSVLSAVPPVLIYAGKKP